MATKRRDFQKALRDLLRLEDEAWEDAERFLVILARLHADLRRLLLESGHYSQANIQRLMRELETITLDYARQLQEEANKAQIAAWMRGVDGFDAAMATLEIGWVKGLTGLEDDLVREYLTINRIVGVTEEMRAAIHGTVMQGVLRQQTPYDVMTTITEIVGIKDMAGYREIGTTGISAKAERIMRTELMTIQSAAKGRMLDQAKDRFPDLAHVWMSTGDGRTRDSHLAAHRQVKPVGEPFTVGSEQAMFPRDPGLSAKERINCRCTEVPYREEWGDLGALIGPVDKSVQAEIERRAEA